METLKSHNELLKQDYNISFRQSQNVIHRFPKTQCSWSMN